MTSCLEPTQMVGFQPTGSGGLSWAIGFCVLSTYENGMESGAMSSGNERTQGWSRIHRLAPVTQGVGGRLSGLDPEQSKHCGEKLWSALLAAAAWSSAQGMPTCLGLPSIPTVSTKSFSAGAWVSSGVIHCTCRGVWSFRH